MPVSQGHIELEEKHFRESLSADELSNFAGYPVFTHDLMSFKQAQKILTQRPLTYNDLCERCDDINDRLSKTSAFYNKSYANLDGVSSEQLKFMQRKHACGSATTLSGNMQFYCDTMEEYVMKVLPLRRVRTTACQKTTKEVQTERRFSESFFRAVAHKDAKKLDQRWNSFAKSYRPAVIPVLNRAGVIYVPLDPYGYDIKCEGHYFRWREGMGEAECVSGLLGLPADQVKTSFGKSALFLYTDLHEARHLVQFVSNNPSNQALMEAEIDADKFYFDKMKEAGHARQAKEIVLTYRTIDFLTADDDHATAPLIDSDLRHQPRPDISRVLRSRDTLQSLLADALDESASSDVWDRDKSEPNCDRIIHACWTSPQTVYSTLRERAEAGAFHAVDPLVRESAHKIVKAVEGVNPNLLCRPSIQGLSQRQPVLAPT